MIKFFKTPSFIKSFIIISCVLISAYIPTTMPYNYPCHENQILDINRPNKIKIATTKDTLYLNSLTDSIKILEEKAEILNRYLMAKHIEYIEVCNLTYKKK